MSYIAPKPYYLFTREQLLAALEQHVAEMHPEIAFEVRNAVLQFLESPAATANRLVVAPAPIKVRENSV